MKYTIDHIEREIARSKETRDYYIAVLKLVDERIAEWKKELADLRASLREEVKDDNKS